MGKPVDVNTVVNVRFRGGAMGTLNTFGNAGRYDERIAVHGAKGCIVFYLHQWQVKSVSYNDEKESVKWFRKAAELGNADAMLNLGLLYDIGKGMLEDDKEVVKWYRKAAEMGNAQAMGLLAGMYYQGKGVIKDYVEAYGWINVAAANGYKGAAKLRDNLETIMPHGQIAEGQKRSREILESVAKE